MDRKSVESDAGIREGLPTDFDNAECFKKLYRYKTTD
jgi:hypothetical protein